MTEAVTSRQSKVVVIDDDGGREMKGAYQCPVYLSGSGDSFTATAATIQGITTTGATAQDALDQAAVAIALAIRAHKSSGRTDAPWAGRPDSPPPGATLKWVLAQT